MGDDYRCRTLPGQTAILHGHVSVDYYDVLFAPGTTGAVYHLTIPYHQIVAASHVYSPSLILLWKNTYSQE